MGLVALATAPDEGAAEPIASSLELRAIPFEIVPQVNMVYLGGATRLFTRAIADANNGLEPRGPDGGKLNLLATPPTGDERDRAERQRLADQHHELTLRVETMILRGQAE